MGSVALLSFLPPLVIYVSFDLGCAVKAERIKVLLAIVPTVAAIAGFYFWIHVKGPML
jgi:hypothetical protein